jgi:hypothetical protein
VTVLGALSERCTYTSRFRIQPFVARIDGPRRLVVDPGEVAAVLTVPLDHFRRGARAVLLRQHQATTVELPCVHVGAHPVWGATLDIIDDLLASPLLALA